MCWKLSHKNSRIFEVYGFFVVALANIDTTVDFYPQMLTKLHFGYAFNKSVENLPQSLQILKFGVDFNQPIIALPTNLQKLSLKGKWVFLLIFLFVLFCFASVCFNCKQQQTKEFSIFWPVCEFDFPISFLFK